MKTSLSILLSFAITCVMFINTEALAQNKSKSTNAGSDSSRRDLDSSAKKVKVKYNSKTNIDFEDTNITGMAKNPFASMVTSRDPKLNSGFLKIRYDWHDMLVMSASGLSQ